MAITSIESEFSNLLNQQRAYYQTGSTMSYESRIKHLNQLRAALIKYEDEIISALQKDLHKPITETLLCEIYLLIQEIDFIKRHLASWMKSHKVSSSIPLNFPGKSYRLPEPYGLSLIIAPWNYPLSMALLPTIGSIAAGNCITIKPSEIAPATENLLDEIITNTFPKSTIQVIKGDVERTSKLLAHPFDHIFFTGSPAVGKIIMGHAAKHLTPITLELGGKSPCIIDSTINIESTAKKIIWAKMTNAGQTCIAPDFVVVHKSLQDSFLTACKAAITTFFGDNPKNSLDYARIINSHHFQRITTLYQNESVYSGGETDPNEKYISPTLLHPVAWDAPIMQEEIFGPVLPVLTYSDLSQVISTLKQRPKPLACYLFSNDQETITQVTTQLSFGTACINDCLTQITNPNLPFGGVGNSGIGQYRGLASFETFSHFKNIFQRPSWFNVPLAYPPYSHTKLKWLRRLLRL